MRFHVFFAGALVAGALTIGCKEEAAETETDPSGTTATPPTQPATAPAGGAGTSTSAAAEGDEGDKITAKIESKSDSKVNGEVTLIETEDGVKISAMIHGPKGGTHAVHIHEKGDCSAPDAKSAGDHFNPEGHKHGMPNADEKHLGDLGNVTIGDNGMATLEIEVKGANLKEGDEKSFAGRALIIHEKQDDGSQPAGNAGARVGCAVLQAAT